MPRQSVRFGFDSDGQLKWWAFPLFPVVIAYCMFRYRK